MRNFAIVAAFALIASISWGQDSPGMYADQGGQLVKMEHARTPDFGTKGVAKSVFVPGAGASGVWIYSGSQSPVRVSARPRFLYRLRPGQSGDERDIVLVRMDAKSNSREIRFVKVSGWTGNSRGGFDQKKLVAITVTRTGDTIEIVPTTDLEAGEYLATWGMSPVGYDFGVTK
jgi:hypothetical protein